MTTPIGDLSLWYPQADQVEDAVIFDTAGHHTWTAPEPPSGKTLSSVWVATLAAGPVGVITAWQDVAPGETLDLYVGGCPTGGAGGYNGGGNGPAGPIPPRIGGGYGATDVRQHGTGLGDRVLVAGASGGVGLISTDGSTLSQDGVGVPNGVPAERQRRWLEPFASFYLPPDESNVIYHDPGGVGQGGHGASAGGTVSEGLEWPSGAAHYVDDGLHEVTVDHDVIVYAGGGGGGWVGGKSGYITYLDVGGIWPWLPANLHTPDDGDTDNVAPNPAPPAYWVPPEFDEFGTLVTSGHWVYPYGNPRDEPWPYTEESEIPLSIPAGLENYAGYRQSYMATGGASGSYHDAHEDDPLWGATEPPYGTAILADHTADMRWDTDGKVIIIYGFIASRRWNVGHVGSANPSAIRL